jgi:hypothetical protein
MAKSSNPSGLKIDNEAQFFADFPNLKAGAFRVTSPATPMRDFPNIYNCFAYTVDKRQWWWPTSYGKWPADCAFGDVIESFIAAYKQFGFEQCADGGFERGKDKVAVYMVGLEVKHVAIQLRSRGGAWRSKCGLNVDIEHSLEALEGAFLDWRRSF